jgi:protein gp37
MSAGTLAKPDRWNKEALKTGERPKVFCMSLGDVFEDHPALPPWRVELFERIDRCQALRWLVLTKRPENIGRMWPDDRHRENVWLGTSIANQRIADLNIDRLLEARHLAKLLFLSVEPQLEFVDLSPWLSPVPLLDWVIVGGESDQGVGPPRRFDIRWARDVIQQCGQARVPCFVKQLGANAWEGNRRLHFLDRHFGGDWLEWPEDLRVRECPESYAEGHHVQVAVGEQASLWD